MISFNKRFKILQRIGSGSFGDVHRGTDLTNNKTVAIKIETRTLRHSRLLCEYKLYKKLQSTGQDMNGIPEIIYFGNFKNQNVLVMEQLGNSLENLFNRQRKRYKRNFSLQTVLLIGIQILKLLEFIHQNRIIHRDIKPDNFLIGKTNPETIYMIDFGLSSQFKNGRKHIHYSEDNSLTGTLRYASARNHIGIEQSRRDDLESLGYMLIYFIKGKLPWQGLKGKTKEIRRHNIKMKKLMTKVSDLCEDLPKEFYDYMCYCKNLDFSETPNYAYLKSLFKKLYTKKYQKNIKFDWIEK